MFEKYPDKIHGNGSLLSLNPNAIYFLEQNRNLVNWRDLSCNPNIFDEADYVCK